MSGDAPPRPDAADVPGDGVLEVEDVAIRVSAETSRRLACDASVVTMPHDADGHVLDVGRKTRTIPAAIRRALSARGSELRIAPPQPRVDIGHPLAPTTARLAAQNIVITPRTLPTWDGGPFNLGYALDVLYVPSATLRRAPS